MDDDLGNASRDTSHTAPGQVADCPGCGLAVAPTDRFCARCGSSLEGTVPKPPVATTAGERRQLTIMFCDLVGSTALSEQLDPEDLGELVLAYQEMGRETVQRFGGHVAQYLGDGLLAYFGYPVAHEDDADRAVLAGLAILAGLDGLNEGWDRSFGVRLDARVGIHAGPTIVGAMGSADRSDTSAFGSTPNVAARLEGQARPGTVVVSDEVRQALGAHFALVDKGTPALKGITRPIRVWEVTGVTEITARTVAPSSIPVIGRDRELAELFDLVERAQRGEAQTALLIGEPGIGKSRLLQALYEHLSGAPHLWLEGQCAELSEASTLAPVIDLLRRSLDLGRPDGTRDAWARLVDALAPLGSVAGSTTLYLADLLGVRPPDHLAGELRSDDGPELRRRRSLDALVDWTRRLAGEQLVVVVLEDLHWSDPTTLGLVSMLTRPVPGCRLLCVFTARPGEQFAWAEDESVTRIDLSRLPAMDAEVLTRAFAMDHGLSSAVVDAVADRSDGVPLFIEELVKAATESTDLDAGDEIPRTLHALLAARLDRLGPARAVAQAASVLGREFPLQLLGAVAAASGPELERALDDLQEAGVLDTRNTPGGISCLFRHALIQDAAYSSLLRRERRLLHGTVADVLETQFASRVEQSPELLAHHLGGADRPLEAAGWYERAGRLAAERAASAEALAHFRSGLALLADLEPTTDRETRLLSLHILVGNVLMGSSGLGSEEALPAWEAAIASAERLGDHDELTSALNGAAVFHADRANTATAIELSERILEVAERTGSRVASLRANGTLGMIRFYQGDGTRALAHLDVAMALTREGDFFTVTYGLGHDEETTFHLLASWVQWWLGRPDKALEVARGGLEVALRIPSSLSQAMARHGLATAHHLRGEGDAAERTARENLALCEELGFPFWGGLAMAVLGTRRAMRGDHGGIEQLTAGLDRLAEIGNMAGAAFGMVFLAEANLGLGRPQDAIDAAELGLATGEVLEQPFYEAELLRLKALGQVALGRPEAARPLLEQSLAVAVRMGARSAALKTSVSLAEILGVDEPSAAAGLLQDGLGSMGDGEATPDQQRARDLMARLHVAG